MPLLSGALAATGLGVFGWAVGKGCDVSTRKTHEVFVTRLRAGKLDPNHDIERAILRAHYGALQFLVDETVRMEKLDVYGAGVNNARQFLNGQIKAVNKKNIDNLAAALAQDWKGLVPATFEGADISVPQKHVDAALAELLAVNGWDEDEKQILTSRAYDKTKGWVTAFSAHIRHELKDNKEFRAIYTAEVLNIHTIKLDTILDALPSLSSLARDVKQVKEVTADTNADVKDIKAIAENSDARLNDLTNMVARLVGDKSVSSQDLESLRRQIIKLEVDKALTHDRLKRFLSMVLPKLTIEDGHVQENLQDLLNQVLKDHEDYIKQANIPSNDPQILKDLRAEIAKFLQDFEHDKARKAVKDTRDKMKPRLEESARDDAALLVEEARIENSTMNTKIAMELYERASTAIDRYDRDQAVKWLWKAASLGYNHGVISGHGVFLEEAVRLYQQALTYVSDVNGRGLPNQSETWGQLKNNLGNVYQILGARGDDTDSEKAIASYKDALEERTRDKVPLLWAMTKNNLGNVYARLGERGDVEFLETAIIVYEDALKERRRDIVPLDWATTKNNLGNVYQYLGDGGEAGAFEMAISAYEDALEERGRDIVPLDWAMTKNNLGAAYVHLGRRGDAVALEKAIEFYEDALKERRRDIVPQDWATTKNNLGNVYQFLGSGGEVGAFEKAITVFGDALDERTRDKMPLQWAITTVNLGRAFWGKGDSVVAEKCFRGALEVFRELRVSYYIEHVETTMRGFGLDPDVE